MPTTSEIGTIDSKRLQVNTGKHGYNLYEITYGLNEIKI